MRYYNPVIFNTYSGNRIVKFSFFLALILNLSLWLGVFWEIQKLPESVPLHYNIYFGIDRLGSSFQLLWLPLLGLIFLVFNFFLGLAVFSKERLLSQLLAGASVFSQLILILAAIFILLVNF